MTEEEERLGSDFVEHGIGEEVTHLLGSSQGHDEEKGQGTPEVVVRKSAFGFSSPKINKVSRRAPVRGVTYFSRLY